MRRIGISAVWRIQIKWTEGGPAEGNYIYPGLPCPLLDGVSLLTPLGLARKRLPPAWFGASSLKGIVMSQLTCSQSPRADAIAQQRAPDLHLWEVG